MQLPHTLKPNTFLQDTYFTYFHIAVLFASGDPKKRLAVDHLYAA